MKPRRSDFSSLGFTLAEVLIAAAIGAAVITAAAIGFAVVSGASLRGGRLDVQLPGNAYVNLYGNSASYVTVWPNPNYSEAAKARALRDKLTEDVSAAVAVFCLGRNGTWTNARPGSVSFPGATDLRNFSTPSNFRQFLVTNNVPGASGFATNQNGVLTATNMTIYVVAGLAASDISTNANSLRFVSTYEVDFVPATSPAGIYASVRRYDPDEGNVPTDFYHCFYPDEANGSDGFRPLGVYFGRESLGGVYDIAPNQPFNFMWWPDPLVSRLDGVAVPAVGGAPLRSAYSNMAGRTSLFSVLPSFPGQ